MNAVYAYPDKWNRICCPLHWWGHLAAYPYQCRRRHVIVNGVFSIPPQWSGSPQGKPRHQPYQAIIWVTLAECPFATALSFSFDMLLGSIFCLLALGAHAAIVAPTTEQLSFLAIGDWGGTDGAPYYEPGQMACSHGMAKVAHALDSKFVVALGDNFYGSGIHGNAHNPRFRETFEDVYTDKALQTPWYIIAGNHDHLGNVTAQIEYTQWSARWRSHCCSPLLVILLRLFFSATLRRRSGGGWRHRPTRGLAVEHSLASLHTETVVESGRSPLPGRSPKAHTHPLHLRCCSKSRVPRGRGRGRGRNRAVAGGAGSGARSGGLPKLNHPSAHVYPQLTPPLQSPGRQGHPPAHALCRIPLLSLSSPSLCRTGIQRHTTAGHRLYPAPPQPSKSSSSTP